MELVKIMNNLYQSPLIDDWAVILDKGINVVIDLEDIINSGVPKSVIYIYWGIEDGPLPDTNILWGIAGLGAKMIKNGYKVLVSCVGGFNRSALINACIIKTLHPDLRGAEIIELIRKARPGALSNPTFFDFLMAIK
ncbi:MAG: dual specificity protein phosphatase family protein [Candidatus Stahlbacteria bacterium]|nr:dual specificity protein phosphatase family protein [Candidatus Stahlbacteria bacterium]